MLVMLVAIVEVIVDVDSCVDKGIVMVLVVVARDPSSWK